MRLLREWFEPKRKRRHGRKPARQVKAIRKETGTMENLKATQEERYRIEEAQRNERVAIERGRQVEDLLHRCIGDVADARATLHSSEKRVLDAERKSLEAYWKARRLVDRLTAVRNWIQNDHLKKFPKHKRSVAEAAVNQQCSACLLYIGLQDELARCEKELPR